MVIRAPLFSKIHGVELWLIEIRKESISIAIMVASVLDEKEFKPSAVDAAIHFAQVCYENVSISSSNRELFLNMLKDMKVSQFDYSKFLKTSSDPYLRKLALAYINLVVMTQLI